MVAVLCLVAPEPRFLAEAFQEFVSSETVRQNSAISSANRVMNGADGQSGTLENVTCAFSVKQTFLLLILCLNLILIPTKLLRNP